MVNKTAKTISIFSIAALTLGITMPGFAEVPTADVGNQSGSGTTTLKLRIDNTEYGGTEDLNNPDISPADDLGDNLAFTVPSELDFVVKANGDLLCPSPTATYINNETAYGIHVSSAKVDQESGWNIVADATSATTSNAVSMIMGPAMDTTEKINLQGFLNKTAISNGSGKWGMSAKDTPQDKDELHLSLEGKAKNLTGDFSNLTPFGTIHWYLAAGGEGQRYIDPANRITINKIASTGGSFKVGSSASGNDDWDFGVEDDRMYVIAQPDDGYFLNSINITKVSDNSAVNVETDIQNNVGVFTMPGEEINIEVSFRLPSLASTYTMSQLQTASEAIRNGDTTVINQFLPYAQAGETVSVTLGGTEGGTSVATLVDVHQDYGLVFMLDKITDRGVNFDGVYTNAGGWASSGIRSKLQSGGSIYTAYLQNMKMSLADETEQLITPQDVTTYSSVYETSGTNITAHQQTTANDKFFLPSAKEIYGVNATTGSAYTRGAQYETNGHQFAYFGADGLNVTSTNYSPLAYDSGNGWTKAAGSTWWLRSAYTLFSDAFHVITPSGSDGNFGVYCSYAILPCFCL